MSDVHRAHPADSVHVASSQRHVEGRSWLSRRPSWLWPLWGVTRAVLLVLCATYSIMPRDLEYYYAQANAYSYTTAMREYPFPVALWLMLPAKIMPFFGYVALFVVTALLCDAAATWLFGRRFGRLAAMRWTVLVALLGPLMYMRFDLYAAFALVLVLVFGASSHPSTRGARDRDTAVAGLAAAAGSAIKLWPAVFGLGLVGPLRRRILHMAAAVCGGVAWVVATTLIAGPQRVVSPLKWQGERGFEIESLWGALIGLERLFGDSIVHMNKRQGSWEYTGAVADQWMFLVKPTQYVGYALALGLLALGAWAGRDQRASTLALTMTSVVSVLILSSPVLSPQYLIWLLPGFVLLDDARLRHLAYVVVGLTQLELPFLFDGFYSDQFWFECSVRLVVIVRNAVLLWLTVRAVTALVRRARAARYPASASSTSPAIPA